MDRLALPEGAVMAWDRCSASQLKTFRRCPSRWYFEKIVGLETPTSEAMARGTRIHTMLEDYLVEGVDIPDTDEGRIALPALERLPDKGSVARDMVERRFELPADVLGVRFVGIIDLVEPDIITDHKTTSATKYTKTEEELKADPQAQAYSIEMAQTRPGPVSFRHVYMLTKGAPKSMETRVTFEREELVDAVLSLRATVSDMLETSSLGDVSKASFNLEACNDFGGCPFRSQCASVGRPTRGLISGLFTSKVKTMEHTDPLAALLASRTTTPPINPPDGTPEMELPPVPEPDPQQELIELEDIEPEETTKKRRGLRLPDGSLVSRASKSELAAYAQQNKIIVEPPEGRSQPGTRELREAIEAFMLFIDEPSIDPEDEPVEEVVEKVVMNGLSESFEHGDSPVTDGPVIVEDVEPDSRFVLYINAAPRGSVTYLEDVLSPLAHEVAVDSGAPHYLMLPYNTGPKKVAALLAHKLRQGDVVLGGPVVADMRLPSSEASVEVLLPYAQEVVRKF